MNFGEILDKWEEKHAVTEIYDKDAAAGNAGAGGNRRYRLLRKRPDDSIDLHGLNRDEAWLALETFFENSRRRGFEKLLIIHGKGSRQFPAAEVSGDGKALRDISRRFIEHCSFAGESGYCPAKDGGTGATWVILKEGS